MPAINIDVDPCEHFSADAIGKPGQRVFYLHAHSKLRSYTVIIEKAQLIALASGIEQLLGEIGQKFPDLAEARGDYAEDMMRLRPPFDPLFRVGEIGLGYDQERDLAVVFAKELMLENQDPEEASQIRFWVSRDQLRQLARWGAEISSRGRPICPQCGQPMDAEGHFCPKKNGHLH